MSEKPPKTIRVVAAVIERDGRYLITQRRPNAVLPMLWEFPGGRCEEGESDEEALRREVDERLGAQVNVAERWVSFTSATYEKYTVDFYLYECELLSDALSCRAVHDFRWVRSDEFDNYDFTPVDEASINQLLGET
ncbi:MAG: (deoxy)nucleoside triphosphate pyrophosphohydrolase [Myxococcota bacterium]